MKVVQVNNKKVLNAASLKKRLQGAGFSVENIVAAQGVNPFVQVWLADLETKDPTPMVRAYVDPDVLSVASDKPPGSDMVPECPADGVATHTLTIKKKDPYTGADKTGMETVQILPSQMIVVTPSQVVLVNGQTTVKVGPTQMVGELFVRVVDVAGVLIEGSIRLRFV